MIRMFFGRFLGEVFRVCFIGRRFRGRFRIRWRDYIFRLVWERFGVFSDKLEEVVGEREVWVFLFRLLFSRFGFG